MLIVVEEGSAIEDAGRLLHSLPGCCCICPPSIAPDLLKVLEAERGSGRSDIELIVLSDAALAAHSSDDYRAARLAQELTSRIQVILEGLVTKFPTLGLTSRNMRDLSLTLEGVIYSQFCAPIAVIQRYMDSTAYDGVIVCPGPRGSDFPLAKVVAATRSSMPVWLAEAPGSTAVVRDRLASWRINGEDAPSWTSDKAAEEVAGLTDLLRMEEGEFLGELEMQPLAGRKCGLFVAQNTDAVGEEAASVLSGLSDVAPMIAVAFGLRPKARQAYWDSLVAGGEGAGRIRRLDVPLSAARFERAAKFLHGYVSEGLRRLPGVELSGGYDFSAELAKVIRNRAERAFSLSLAGLARSRAVVRRFRPDFALAYPAVNMHARQLVSVARDSGIPTFDVQSIFVSDHPRNVMRWTDSADMIMAMDDRFAACLVQHMGWPIDRVRVIGSPRIDPLSRRRPSRGQSAVRRSHLRIDSDVKIVSFFTQFNQVELNIGVIKSLINMTQDLDTVQIVAKLHPRMRNEEVDEIRRFAALSCDMVIVSEGLESSELIEESDVVITSFSNVALEAAILGRPVLLFNMGREELSPPLDLGNWGIGEDVRDYDQGRRALRSLILEDECVRRAQVSQEEFFRINPQYRDGRSIDRIVEEVRRRIAH